MLPNAMSVGVTQLRRSVVNIFSIPGSSISITRTNTLSSVAIIAEITLVELRYLYALNAIAIITKLMRKVKR